MPPKVSVNIVCYNHEHYIGPALESVLNQTFGDMEILLLNNGSTDRSLSVMERYQDNRIRISSVFPNQQSTWAGKKLMEQATGEYVALLCSDDIWEKDKLRQQVAYLDAHPDVGAVFTRVQPIDENGDPIRSSKNPYHKQFNTHPNRSSARWLNDMWQRADHAFCCSSALIRREALAQAGYYDVRLKYVQDMNLWANLLTRYEVYILEEKLTRMRSFSKHTNLSARSLKTSLTVLNESFILYEQFKKIKDVEKFLEFMPQAKNYFSCIESKYIPFYVAVLTLTECPKIHFKQAALKDLYDLMASEQTRAALEKDLHFTHLDLYRLVENFYPTIWKRNLWGRWFPPRGKRGKDR